MNKNIKMGDQGFLIFPSYLIKKITKTKDLLVNDFVL